MSVVDIVNGHVKELFNENESLFNNRLKICKECLLYKESQLGQICNNKLWISKDGKNASAYPKVDYVKGCGCDLRRKTKLPNAKCVIFKW